MGVPLVVCQLGLIRGDRVAARLVLSVRLPGRRLDVSWSVGGCRCLFCRISTGFTVESSGENPCFNLEAQFH